MQRSSADGFDSDQVSPPRSPQGDRGGAIRSLSNPSAFEHDDCQS